MILKNNTADIIVSRQFMNSDLAQKGLLWLPFVLLTALLLLLLLLSFVRFHVKNKHRYVKRRREGDSEVLSQLADGTINVAALPRKHSQRRMSMCASTVNVRSVVRDSLLEQMERARKNSRGNDKLFRSPKTSGLFDISFSSPIKSG